MSEIKHRYQSRSLYLAQPVWLLTPGLFPLFSLPFKLFIAIMLYLIISLAFYLLKDRAMTSTRVLSIQQN